MEQMLPALTCIFFLATPMDRSEYAKIKIIDISSEFMEEYNLRTFDHNRWVYFEIFRGCYGLPQIGNKHNYLLRTSLN